MAKVLYFDFTVPGNIPCYNIPYSEENVEQAIKNLHLCTIHAIKERRSNFWDKDQPENLLPKYQHLIK